MQFGRHIGLARDELGGSDDGGADHLQLLRRNLLDLLVHRRSGDHVGYIDGGDGRGVHDAEWALELLVQKPRGTMRNEVHCAVLLLLCLRVCLRVIPRGGTWLQNSDRTQ